LTEIDGIVLTYRFADAALLLLQIDAALIDICDQGNGLREVDMDGFVARDFLIKDVRVDNRAVIYTGGTARAITLDNIPGLANQGYPKVPCFSFYPVNVRIG
jgi:hypothetical protein